MLVGSFSAFVGAVEIRRHLVGFRSHDQPLHLLDAPALADELGGQPIEQFGIRRQRAHLAEIAGRADDAGAEVPSPDAIDHHARRQRIVVGGDPFGQGAPASAGELTGALGRIGHGEFAQTRVLVKHLQEARLDQESFIVGLQVAAVRGKVERRRLIFLAGLRDEEPSVRRR